MKTYFKYKLWIADLLIVLGLSYLSGVLIFSDSGVKNVMGWILLVIILYLVGRVVKVLKAIRKIEDIIEKYTKQ